MKFRFNRIVGGGASQNVSNWATEKLSNFSTPHPNFTLSQSSSGNSTLSPSGRGEKEHLAAWLPSCLAAFTLAEVLVTLGVIGVVSAMTIPTLMTNHQRKVYATQLHKVYNEFQQATEMFISEKNAVSLTEAGLRSNDDVDDFMSSKFKIVKSCTGFSGCFADSYKNLNGSAVTNDSSSHCYVIASGASVCLSKVSTVLINNLTGAATPIGTPQFIIKVDSNGKNGPNKLGKDLFVMGLDNTTGMVGVANVPSNFEVLNANADNSTLAKCKRATSLTSSSAYSCFELLLNNGWEMTY